MWFALLSSATSINTWSQTNSSHVKSISSIVGLKSTHTFEMHPFSGNVRIDLPSIHLQRMSPATAASDIWSVGSTVVEMVTKNPPYAEQHQQHLMGLAGKKLRWNKWDDSWLREVFCLCWKPKDAQDILWRDPRHLVPFTGLSAAKAKSAVGTLSNRLRSTPTFARRLLRGHGLCCTCGSRPKESSGCSRFELEPNMVLGSFQFYKILCMISLQPDNVMHVI